MSEQKIVVRGIDALILAIKASGGHRFRAMLQLQEGQELNNFIAGAEARLRWMAHCLEIAEAMLREPPPSTNHMPRWDEYLQRLTSK